MQRNKRMKEMILSMAGALVAAVIGCLVLVMESYRAYVLFIVVGIWSMCLWYRLRKVHRVCKRQPKERTMQIIDLEPDYKKLFSQQLQLRVQEKLLGKFPGAVVDLCEKEVEQLATTGKMVYVPIQKADDYCHIGISLKDSGEITMSLFSLVSLDEVREKKKTMPAEKEVDVEQWFTQKGQMLLTELITNMNSRGYTKLSINENGDVTVKENGRNVLKDHFQEIPSKKHWTKLKDLMEEEDVQVQVSGKQLTFAW